MKTLLYWNCSELALFFLSSFFPTGFYCVGFNEANGEVDFSCFSVPLGLLAFGKRSKGGKCCCVSYCTLSQST
jgi:hypothetical protein